MCDHDSFFSSIEYILTPFTMRTHAPSGNVSVSFVRSLSSDLGIKWDLRGRERDFLVVVVVCCFPIGQPPTFHRS